MAKKKAATKAERAHMNAVAEMGCMICQSPATLHHILNGTMGKRASNYEVIPLCPYHHQQGPFGEAVHNGTKTWEAKYGTQKELLAQVLEQIKGSI